MPTNDSDASPAELVRELRGNQSHDRFAATLGTSRQTVIRWEQGAIPERYADALAALSGGRYSAEQFNPRNRGYVSQRAALARLEDLEQRHARLEERVAGIEKRLRRSR
ncbi:MAG TPA: hypothetical protein VFI04_09150 [Gaiellaceae bacterium]|nr:hypothetical protein [Gaiellaceae bacterium]